MSKSKKKTENKKSYPPQNRALKIIPWSKPDSYPRGSQISNRQSFVKQIVIKRIDARIEPDISFGFILKKNGLVQESNPTYVSDFGKME